MIDIAHMDKWEFLWLFCKCMIVGVLISNTIIGIILASSFWYSEFLEWRKKRLYRHYGPYRD